MIDTNIITVNKLPVFYTTYCNDTDLVVHADGMDRKTKRVLGEVRSQIHNGTTICNSASHY